jgi:hypothetical protein
MIAWATPWLTSIAGFSTVFLVGFGVAYIRLTKVYDGGSRKPPPELHPEPGCWTPVPEKVGFARSSAVAAISLSTPEWGTTLGIIPDWTFRGAWNVSLWRTGRWMS